LNRWTKLSSWQKGALTGISVQMLLLFAFTMSVPLFYEWKALHKNLVGWHEIFNWILNPLVTLYCNFLINSRIVQNPKGSVCCTVYFWESGILLPLFRVIYASAVGALIAKVLENKRGRSPIIPII